MKLALPVLLLTFALTSGISCQEKEAPEPVTDEVADVPLQVAITIDDLPFVGRIRSADAVDEMTVRLLKHLTDHQVEAVGFVNEGKMHANGRPIARQTALLQKWVDAGMDLGNHTRNHPSFHRIDLASFKKDVTTGEAITESLLSGKGRSLRYFRHPYLHTGNTPEKKAGLEEFLEAEGYQVAPVTVDNSDWIYAAAYDRAIQAGDEEMKRRIGESFVNYIEEKFEFYERQSKKLFGRDINQILLLHANSVNADYLAELLARLKARGYAFITLAEALEDTAFETKNEYTGLGGISWLDRWALTQGKSGDFFAGEPPCPSFIQDYAGLEE